MNHQIQAQFAVENPFEFKNIKYLKSLDHFEDLGMGCVVMASPGMLQNGVSRILFDKWCSNPRNGIYTYIHTYYFYTFITDLHYKSH